MTINRLLPETNASTDEEQQTVTPATAVSDALLLEQFIHNRDATAFSTLVLRYQQLVMGVALRQVGDRHRADDVFQATFLVLAEQAHRIRKPNSLASWLHGTARRIGLRALTESQRMIATSPSSILSQNFETTMTDPALENVEHAFEQQALDEELAKLPDKLREPLVLHYLDGLTGREVAERLDLTVDTVEGRLKRGRNQLRQRLMRRGIGFGIVLAAFQMSQQAAVAASTTTLVKATTTSAVAWVSQQTLQGCSANAAHLAGKELAAMTATKMTTMLACTAMLCLAGGAIGAWAFDSPGTGPVGTRIGSGTIVENETIETTLAAQAESAGNPIPVGSSAGPGVSTPDPQPAPYYESNAPVSGRPIPVSAQSTIGSHIENRTYRKMSPVRKAVEEKLDQELQLESAEIPSPDDLANVLMAHGIPAMIDQQALEDIGLSVDEPGLAPRFEVPGITLRENLEIMLEPMELKYIVKNGVLTITTRDVADSHRETVVYELRHLGANLPAEDVHDLLFDIPDSIWMNTDGEGGSASVIPGGIVVSQTQEVHRKIVDLIEQLEEFAANADLPQVERNPGQNAPSSTPAHPVGGGGFGGGGQGSSGGGMGGGGFF